MNYLIKATYITLFLLLGHTAQAVQTVENKSSVLVQMFEWWNASYKKATPFTEAGFAQYFTEDIVFIVNGKHSEKGIKSLTERFNKIKETYHSIAITLPLAEEFTVGNKIFTYHVNRGRENKDDPDIGFTHVMGYVVVEKGKIALLNFLHFEAKTDKKIADYNASRQDLAAFLEAVYQRRTTRDPVLASKQGLKKNYDQWRDLSIQHMNEQMRLHWLDLHTLHTQFDFSALDRRNQLNYQAFEADLKLRIERDSWRYHFNPINQIVGLHLEIPGLLMNSHKVNHLEDARAYISRLQRVGEPIDQFIILLKKRESRGFLLPKSLVPRLVQAAQSIISGDLEQTDKKANILLADFKRKLSGLSLDKKMQMRLVSTAKTALKEHFIPAYQRLIDAFEAHQHLATSDRGVWRLPEGDRFYQFLLRQFTTTDITADQVHTLGLDEVARIHRAMKEIKTAVGFDGDLKHFFQYLKTDATFYYPNSPQGRRDYLQRAQTIVKNATVRAKEMLPVKLPGSLTVRRIEAYREKSAPVGFYEAGNLERDLPGTVYLGMHDMSSAASYDLYALLYHEGIPGHHLQAAIMQSQKHIPNLRKYYVWWSNTAYTEGWALYAEYLAKELELYDDAYADFGRLGGELWRACRLVVDSGLHAKRWTREQAITYLNENTASSIENNTRAVDRYLAVPGQATAFKIGMMEILKLREQVRAQLGKKFDLREFHYVILKNGPLPLYLLKAEIQAWVNDKKRG